MPRSSCPSATSRPPRSAAWRPWPRPPTRRRKARASSTSSADSAATARSGTAAKGAHGAPAAVPEGARFIPFTAQTRMSGIDLADGHQVRKGAPDAILRYVQQQHGAVPPAPRAPWPTSPPRAPPRCWSARATAIAGMVVLEDILKPGITERFERLRRMGLRTVMVTGDNPLTAKAIAAAGRRGRLHRRGHPRGQARLHPQGTGRRQAGRHDGRRHQRCPRPGPGRRRRGHELRHPGRQGSRQHGRPGQRSHQADRGGRDRQATADDPRRADDLLHRQRRGQVFRHRAGHVRRHCCPG